MSDSQQPYELQPSRLLCPWDSSGKNTGVGCNNLLQGIILLQGTDPHLLSLLHWQMDFFFTSITWEAHGWVHLTRIYIIISIYSQIQLYSYLLQLWTFLLVLQVMLFTNFFLQISSYPYFLSVFLTLVHSTSSSSYLITFTYVALSFFFTFSDSASSLWKFYLLIILLSHIYPFSSILMLSLLHISRHFIYYCIAYCIIFCIYEFLSFPYSLYFSSVARIYFMFFF